MGWFRCRMSGVNFPGTIVGQPGLIEFSVTRYVETDTKTEARKAAILQLKLDNNVDFSVVSELSNTGVPLVKFEKIESVAFSEVPEFEPPYFAFPMVSESETKSVAPKKRKTAPIKVAATRKRKAGAAKAIRTNKLKVAATKSQPPAKQKARKQK